MAHEELETYRTFVRGKIAYQVSVFPAAMSGWGWRGAELIDPVEAIIYGLWFRSHAAIARLVDCRYRVEVTRRRARGPGLWRTLELSFHPTRELAEARAAEILAAWCDEDRATAAPIRWPATRRARLQSKVRQGKG